MEHTYRTNPFGFALVLAVLSVMSVVAPGVALALPAQPFLAFWLAAVALGWYVVAYRTAYAVAVTNGQATFRSLLRRVTVPVAAIGRIDVHTRVIWIRVDDRRLDAFPLDGIDDFVRRVRAANPAVEVNGI